MTLLDELPEPRLRSERVAADKRVLLDGFRTRRADEPRVSAWLGMPRRHATLVGGVLAITAAIGLIVALVIVHPGGAPRTGPGSKSGAALDWRLVSDVSPTWRVVPSTGYLPQNGLPGLGFGLTCPTASTCYAVSPSADGTSNLIEVTNDSGLTWTDVTPPVGLSGLGGAPLACVDATTCATLDFASSGALFYETTNGGASWSSQPAPSGVHSAIDTRLACSTATSCLLVTGGAPNASLVQIPSSGSPMAYRTDDGGATWMSSPLPAGTSPHELTCTSPQDCVVSGGNPFTGRSVLFTTDGGSSWTSASAPAGTAFPGGLLSSLSCATKTSTCLATSPGSPGAPGSALIGSTDGGKSWTSVAAAGLPQGAVTGLSCTRTLCWATGVSRTPGETNALNLDAPGFVASSSDDGQDWQPAQLPSGVAAVIDVSCPSASSCFALAIPHVDQRGASQSQPLLFLAYAASSAG